MRSQQNQKEGVTRDYSPVVFKFAPCRTLLPGRVGTAHARNLAGNHRGARVDATGEPRSGRALPTRPTGNRSPPRPFPHNQHNTHGRSTRPTPTNPSTRYLTSQQHVVQKRFSRDLGGHDVLPYPQGGQDQRQEAGVRAQVPHGVHPHLRHHHNGWRAHVHAQGEAEALRHHDHRRQRTSK